LPRCPEARGNIFNPELTLTRKFFELSGHANATLTGRVCAPSNGFRAAVYDSIGPPLAFMIVNSGTRWLPEPETFGSKSGRGCRPKGADWPSAAILRWASKWCASLVEESSRQSIKVVENFGGAKKGRMTVIMRADCVCLAIARVPASAETVAGAAAHHRGGPFAWAEVVGNFTGGAECGDFCFGGEMHVCRLGSGQIRGERK
jgi:hypothetical protein